MTEVCGFDVSAVNRHRWHPGHTAGLSVCLPACLPACLPVCLSVIAGIVGMLTARQPLDAEPGLHVPGFLFSLHRPIVQDYSNGCQHRLQILLRLPLYPMRGHRLL